MNEIDEALLRDKFAGALLGTAVGDALGMPLEGMTYELIVNSFGTVDQMIDGRMPRGHYTDDTQLMIGVAESLIAKDGFNGEDMARTFFSNFEAFRGYGYGTIRVLQHLLDGMNWSDSAKHIFGGGSYGNGAAMRISPVGVLYHGDLQTLRKISENTSRITHTHPLGIEGAVIQAHAISMAVSTETVPGSKIDTDEFIDKLAPISSEDEFQRRLDKLKEFIGQNGKVTKDDLIYYLGNNVQAHKSVPLSIYSFLSRINSFKEAVVFAVNMGGDTDTLGAMTGAIAGAYHGASKIPGDWLDALENNGKGRDHIKELSKQLYELHKKIATQV